MNLHYETVSASMRSIAKIIHDNLDERFYLAGGTALALLIGHRTSIDLDYFINNPLDTAVLKRDMIAVFGDGKVEITFQEKNTLWANINGVKVSFISRFDSLLESLVDSGDFRRAGLKDLTVMKLAAICSREEYKDYFDLACIAKITDTRSWLTWWQMVFPKAEPISWMVALAAVDQIPPTPLDLQSDFISVEPVKILKKAEAEIVKFVRGL